MEFLSLEHDKSLLNQLLGKHKTLKLQLFPIRYNQVFSIHSLGVRKLTQV